MLDGVLFFPITPLSSEDTVDLEALRRHLERGLEHGPGGVFIACGTGEFHALSVDEYARVVETAIEVVGGRVPVFAGCGGALAIAKQFAAVASQAGADGLLLTPPYLVTGPSQGLVEYVRSVAGSTELDVIVYHRATAKFTEDSAVQVAGIPNVVGLKDGVGDIELMSRIVRAVTDSVADRGGSFQFFNGLPTAEASQSAYRAIGVPLYSSAAFAFVPDVSMSFFRALEAGDAALVDRLSRDFFHPLARLRDRVPGYAVSLVKAGVALEGIPSGSVRPPLVNAAERDRAELAALILAARAALNAAPASR